MVVQSGQPIDMVVYPNHLQVSFHLFNSFRTEAPSTSIDQSSQIPSRHVSTAPSLGQNPTAKTSERTVNLQVTAWWFVAQNLLVQHQVAKKTRKHQVNQEIKKANKST